MNNSEHECYDEFDSSQQIDGIKRTGIKIVSTFLQDMCLQHLHKGVTNVLSLQPCLLMYLRDNVLMFLKKKNDLER